MNYYEVDICGLKRSLPICPVDENLDIAAFVMFGDVELTVACAENLLKVVEDFDVILTAEAKGIPLAYEMAKQANKPYIVARKYKKAYMTEAVKIDVKSITTDKIQTLYLDITEMESMRDKKVLVIDDVISTGESVHALEYLISRSNGIVSDRAFVLAEGDSKERKDIKYLSTIPLFFK